ncbi:MAG TPA: NAD(P)-binding domain-containing protein [Bradyrhizobium sp.]|nr:NAD(P)-binding domain-containing protein [Bradyrhizobium sp.]
MKTSIIGRGQVGLALAPALAFAGHEVRFGVRDPSDAKHADSETPVYSTRDASAWGEVIIAAIRWDGVERFLAEAGDLAGKVLIDCINPLDFTGGLRRLIPANTSTASLIQARTQAAVVKTLNHVGASVTGHARNYAPKPLQFVAGEDGAAKQTAITLLESIGFDARDAGSLNHAADLEAMARLWIVQASLHGMAPDTSWALIAPD